MNFKNPSQQVVVPTFDEEPLVVAKANERPANAGILQGKRAPAAFYQQLQAALLILEEIFSDNGPAPCEYMDSIQDVKKLGYKSATDVITIYRLQWDRMIIRIIMGKFDNDTRCFEEYTENSL